MKNNIKKITHAFKKAASKIYQGAKNAQLQNWGGYTAIFTTLAVLAAERHIENFVSTLSYLGGEGFFARYGHTANGYALGYAGLSGGQAALALSPAMAGSEDLRNILLLSSATMALGTLKPAFEKIAKNEKIDPYYRYGAECSMRDLEAFVGTVTFFLKAPLVYQSMQDGNTTMTLAFLGWGAADIMINRLHEKYLPGIFRPKPKPEHNEEAQTPPSHTPGMD